jgi:pimeloyl-ACP methyl ester carboxylesterase
MRAGVALFLTFSVSACGVHGTSRVSTGHPLKRGPIRISKCSDSRGRINTRAGEDLTILVHGCNSSAAKFSTLAEVFAFHDQRAYCFSYDDRDSIESAALELRHSLIELERENRPGKITVIGHSQGGLVARAALTNRSEHAQPSQVNRLVTISTPFNGILSSENCGKSALHVFSFGITVAICQIVAGRKWTEIHPRAPFIREPRDLLANVENHLMVITDERDACLLYRDGKCVRDDFVFALEEQEAVQVQSPRASAQRVQAGHVEIVGETGVAPAKLIRILQAHQVLKATPAPKKAELLALLDVLYRG